MPRAYKPRPATQRLADEVARIHYVAKVEIEPGPRSIVTFRRGAPTLLVTYHPRQTLNGLHEYPVERLSVEAADEWMRAERTANGHNVRSGF